MRYQKNDNCNYTCDHEFTTFHGVDRVPARKIGKDRGKRSTDHRADTADERNPNIHTASKSGSQTGASRRMRKGSKCKLCKYVRRGSRCIIVRRSEVRADQEPLNHPSGGSSGSGTSAKGSSGLSGSEGSCSALGLSVAL